MAYQYTPPRSTLTKTGTVAPFANTNVQGDSSNAPSWYKEPTVQPYYQAPTWLREEKIDSLKKSVADWKTGSSYTPTYETKPYEQVRTEQGWAAKLLGMNKAEENVWSKKKWITDEPVFEKADWFTESVVGGVTSFVSAIPTLVNEVPRYINYGINQIGHLVGAKNDLLGERSFTEALGDVTSPTVTKALEIGTGITASKQSNERLAKVYAESNTATRIISGVVRSAVQVGLASGIGSIAQARQSAMSLKDVTPVLKYLKGIDLPTASRTATLIGSGLQSMPENPTGKDISYTWTSALVEAGLELGFGVFDEAAAFVKIGNKAFPTVGGMIGVIAKGAIGEGAEEALQYVAQTGIDYLYYNEGRKFSDMFSGKQLTENVIAGALGGFIFAAYGVAHSKAGSKAADVQTMDILSRQYLNKPINQVTTDDMNYLAQIASDAVHNGEVNIQESSRKFEAYSKGEKYIPVGMTEQQYDDVLKDRTNNPLNAVLFNQGDYVATDENIKQTETTNATVSPVDAPRSVSNIETTTIPTLTTESVVGQARRQEAPSTQATVAKSATVESKQSNEQKFASLVDASDSITQAESKFKALYESDPSIEAEIASRIKTPDDLYNEMYRLKRELEMKKGTESKRWNGIMNLQLLAMKSYAERVLKIKKGERAYAFMEHMVEQLNKSVDEENMGALEDELIDISYEQMTNVDTVDRAKSIIGMTNKNKRQDILDGLYDKLTLKAYTENISGKITESTAVIEPHEMIALGMWAKEMVSTGDDANILKAKYIIEKLAQRMTSSGQFTQASRALYQIIFPEALAKRIIDEADKQNGDINVKDRDKRTKESADIISTHRKESAVEAIKKAIGDMAETGDINFFKRGASPAEMLASRIKADVEKSDGTRRTDLQKMVATLFRVYKETNKTETAKTNPYDAIAEMAVNRKIYANTWDTAKSIVSETFADNPVLQEYFKRLADPTMTKSIMNKVITETFKAMGKSPVDLARAYFVSDGASVNEFLQVLRTQMPNIDNASFDYLSTHLKARFKEEMESRRVRMMEQLRKQYDKYPSKIIERNRQSTKQRTINQLIDAAFKESFSIPEIRKAWADRMGLVDLDESAQNEIYTAMKNIAKMDDEQAKEDAFDELLKSLSGRMIGTRYEKWLSLRRSFMLWSPVSWVKNGMSNSIAAPFYKAMDVVENSLNKIAGDDIAPERRIAGEKWIKQGANITIDGAVERWAEPRKIKRMVESSSKYSVGKLMEREKRIWGNSKFEAFMRVPYSVMSEGKLTENSTLNLAFLGDSYMFRKHFMASLRNRLNAMGYNENMDAETKAKTEKIAADEAYEVAIIRTYRKISAASAMVQAMKSKAAFAPQIKERLSKGDIEGARQKERQADALRAVVDIAIPFVVTPIAIAEQSVKFSPFALAYETVNMLGYGIKRAQMRSAGIEMNADMRARLSRIHHRFAQALVGSVGQFALGALLASLGVLTGAPPDNEKERLLWAQQGKRAYSIFIPGVGSFSIDWIQPAAVSVMMGVEFMNQFQDKEFSLSGLGEATMASIEPLFSQTIIGNIMEIFSSGYGDKKTDVITNFGTDALFQMMPGITRRIARVFDKYERDIYVGNTINVLKNRILSHIPFGSMLIPAKVDIWGNKVESKFVTGGVLARTAGNLLSPFLYSADDRDPLTNEVARLFESTGETAAIPVVASEKLTKTKVNGVEYPEVALEGKDWETYQTILGQTQYQYATVVMQSDRYQKADDAKRVEYIKKAYTEASADAKKEYIKQKYNLD